MTELYVSQCRGPSGIITKIPLVIISDLDDMSGLENADSVCWDSGPAASCAVKHLIDSGRTKIAYLGGEMGYRSCSARYNAFCTTLAENDLEMNPEWEVYSSGTLVDDFEKSVERFADLILKPGQKPDAVFAMNDWLAIRLIEKLHNHHFGGATNRPGAPPPFN
jgi:DNA-binding LacI/PurR family transcriptional regulator